MNPQNKQQAPQFNEQKSDLQQAVDTVNPVQLADNLVVDQQPGEPQPQVLDGKEQTPFIDDSLRTDK